MFFVDDLKWFLIPLSQFVEHRLDSWLDSTQAFVIDEDLNIPENAWRDSHILKYIVTKIRLIVLVFQILRVNSFFDVVGLYVGVIGGWHSAWIYNLTIIESMDEGSTEDLVIEGPSNG